MNTDKRGSVANNTNLFVDGCTNKAVFCAGKARGEVGIAFSEACERIAGEKATRLIDRAAEPVSQMLILQIVIRRPVKKGYTLSLTYRWGSFIITSL